MRFHHPNKEISMAACKFSPALTIKKSDLPVTSKLKDPPAGVTIGLAQLFDPSGKPTDLTCSNDKLSFPIPAATSQGNWNLEIRVQGGQFPIPAIDLVEDCDASQRILTVADPVAKAARAAIEVL